MPPPSKRHLQLKDARSKRSCHHRPPSLSLFPPFLPPDVPQNRRSTRRRKEILGIPTGVCCFPTLCFPLYTCEKCMRRAPVTPLDGLKRCVMPESGAGTGLKTTTSIPENTFIIRYTGRKHTKPCTGPYVLEVLSGKLWLDGATGGNLSRFINHSCDPNCEVYVEPIKGRAMIFAKTPIGQDEELTIRYTHHRKDLPFECRCRCCLLS
jgi:uncharacterized protein